MKKRKVKRYQVGGETEAVPMPDIAEESESERASQRLQREKAEAIGSGAPSRRREIGDYIRQGERAPMAEAEAEKTFKQAFADARREGSKDFTWRGKKYNTELAAPTRRLGAKEKADESASDTARGRVPQASKEEMERRARMEREQALETSSPETALIGGPGLRAVQSAAKALAMKEGAKGVARRIEPSFGAMKDITPRAAQIGREPLKIGREPLKLGMKKGGVVSASKRADGIAQRGKTKGRIC